MLTEEDLGKFTKENHKKIENYERSIKFNKLLSKLTFNIVPRKEKLKGLEEKKQLIEDVLKVVTAEKENSKRYESLRESMEYVDKTKESGLKMEWKNLVIKRGQLLQQLMEDFNQKLSYDEAARELSQCEDRLIELESDAKTSQSRLSNGKWNELEQDPITKQDKGVFKTPYMDHIAKYHNKKVKLENKLIKKETKVYQALEAFKKTSRSKEMAKTAIKEAEKETKEARATKEKAKKNEIKAIAKAKKAIAKSLGNAENSEKEMIEAAKAKVRSVITVQEKKAMTTSAKVIKIEAAKAKAKAISDLKKANEAKEKTMINLRKVEEKLR